MRDHADEMKELLREWPPTSWGQPIPPLGGPEPITYIQAGAVLDSQPMAFLLFAFGKLLEWWDILDPRSIGLSQDHPLAKEMVGQGMVAMSGYRVEV